MAESGVRGSSRARLHSVDRMADACKNITFPQLRWQAVTINSADSCGSSELAKGMLIPKLAMLTWKHTLWTFTQQIAFKLRVCCMIGGSLESANSSILASCDLFKEVVGKKIRVL